ncbi:cytochrome P450 [Coprinopsis marcescibilis]|uniref:Cytochrome P450 n=1 Tax=Coprinopsis marcescibilis TaxID=230819 RepID=A0A5C3L3H9_COPMA|nr:cytochrome P450 [Coprinopsis marcescibilis]
MEANLSTSTSALVDSVSGLPGLLSQLYKSLLADRNVSTFIQGLLVFGGTWFSWRLWKAIAVKNPLDKVPGPKSHSFIGGDIAELINPDAWEYHDNLEKSYAGIARIPNVVGGRMLYVYDPKALYHILLKDQNSYEENDDFIRTNTIVFGKGLLSTIGDHHRKQRKILNPVFSAAHLRDMVPLFNTVAYKLRDSIKLEVSRGKSQIDMYSWMSRTALELIGQSGWGTSFDSLQPDAELHPYYNAIKRFIHVLMKTTTARFLVLPYGANMGPSWLRRFIVNIFPWKTLHDLRDIVDIMHSSSVSVYREKLAVLGQGGPEALREQVGEGKDILSILLKANLSAPKHEKMPEEEVIGQMTTLMFAGMDTTSNALSRILELLSANPNVQDKLREEILEAKMNHGELLYDELHQLPYLDAVCRETLRLYSPVNFVFRTSTKDVMLPLERPVTLLDGEEVNEIMVPEGSTIFISIRAYNRDPLIWGPDAHEWKPERWLSPLPKTVTDLRSPGIYSHLMTFLGGSRACIGFKFSQLEMKVVLCTLIESLKFAPGDKKIKWEFAGISQPTVNQASQNGVHKLEMPMHVSLAA